MSERQQCGLLHYCAICNKSVNLPFCERTIQRHRRNVCSFWNLRENGIWWHLQFGLILRDFVVISDTSELLRKIQRIEATLLDQLIIDVSGGSYAIQPGMTFSQFVSVDREANAMKPHVCFMLLHLHKTPKHRQRLLSTWTEISGVPSDATDCEMNESSLFSRCFIC